MFREKKNMTLVLLAAALITGNQTALRKAVYMP